MIEKAIPRNGYNIFKKQKKVIGIVTSGTMSPSMNIGIGLGYVKIENSSVETEIFIEIRNKFKKAIIVTTPFK